MKKILFFFVLSLLVSFSAKSQYILWSGNVGITGGYTPEGFAGNIEFNYILDPAYMQGALHIAFSNDTYKASENESYKIPYQTITINVGYFYPVYENRAYTIRFAVGGGALGGYETVNNGNLELPNGALIEDHSKFIYGVFGAGEFDYNITRSVLGVVKYNHYYHANSDIGNLTFYVGTGVRIYLN